MQYLLVPFPVLSLGTKRAHKKFGLLGNMLQAYISFSVRPLVPEITGQFLENLDGFVHPFSEGKGDVPGSLI